MHFCKYLLSVLLLCATFSHVHAEAIDINTADAESLATVISGIGAARADAIVTFRKENGPFSSVDDLVLVRGIGPATVDKNRDKITVGKSSTKDQ